MIQVHNDNDQTHIVTINIIIIVHSLIVWTLSIEIRGTCHHCCKGIIFFTQKRKLRRVNNKGDELIQKQKQSNLYYCVSQKPQVIFHAKVVLRGRNKQNGDTKGAEVQTISSGQLWPVSSMINSGVYLPLSILTWTSL